MGKTILTSKQSLFLQLVQAQPSIVKNFYFTGGTALAEFYLQHRLSEDLDLFTEKTEVHIPTVEAFLKRGLLLEPLMDVGFWIGREGADYRLIVTACLHEAFKDSSQEQQKLNVLFDKNIYTECRPIIPLLFPPFTYVVPQEAIFTIKTGPLEQEITAELLNIAQYKRVGN